MTEADKTRRCRNHLIALTIATCVALVAACKTLDGHLLAVALIGIYLFFTIGGVIEKLYHD